MLLFYVDVEYWVFLSNPSASITTSLFSLRSFLWPCQCPSVQIPSYTFTAEVISSMRSNKNTNALETYVCEFSYLTFQNWRSVSKIISNLITSNKKHQRISGAIAVKLLNKWYMCKIHDFIWFIVMSIRQHQIRKFYYKNLLLIWIFACQYLKSWRIKQITQIVYVFNC